MSSPTTKSFSISLKLTPVRHEQELEPIVLREGELTVGSSKECDVVIANEGVAPLHGLFRLVGRRVEFEAKSPLTWLNDGHVRSARLQPGDRIILGPVEYSVQIQTEEDSGSPSQQEGVPGIRHVVHPWERTTDRAEVFESTETRTATDAEPPEFVPRRPASIVPLLQEALAGGSLRESLKKTETEIQQQRAAHRKIVANGLRITEDRPLISPGVNLHTEWETIEAEKELLQRQRAEAEQALDEIEQLKREYKGKCTRLDSEQLAWESHQAAIQKQLDEVRSRLDEKALSLEQAEAELNRERLAVSASQKELEQRTKEWNDRQSELEQKQSEWDNRFAELDRLQENLKQQQAELESQRETLDEQRKALTDAQDAFRLHEEQRTNWLQQREETLAEQEAACQASQAETAKQIEELEARQRALEEQESLLEKNQSQWESEREILEKELAAEREALQQQQRTLEQTRDDLTAREAELAQQQQLLTEERTQIETLREELSEQEKSLKTRIEEFEARETAASSEQQERSHHDDEWESLCSERDRLAIQCDELQRELDRVTSELQTVRNEARQGESVDRDATPSLIEGEAASETFPKEQTPERESSEETPQVTDMIGSVLAEYLCLESPFSEEQDRTEADEAESKPDQPPETASFSESVPAPADESPASEQTSSTRGWVEYDDDAAGWDPSLGLSLSTDSMTGEASEGSSMEAGSSAEGDHSNSLRSQLAELFGIPTDTLNEAAQHYSDATPDAGESPRDEPALEAGPEPVAETAAESDLAGSHTDEPASSDEDETDSSAQEATHEEPLDPSSDSVANYMEQLLARTKNSTTGQPPSTILQDQTSGTNQETKEASQYDTAEIDQTTAAKTATKKLGETEKKVIRENLNSMREIANLSARSAVAKHHARKLQLSYQIKTVVTVVGGVISAVLLTAELWTDMSYRMLGLCTLAITLISGIELARTTLILRRLSCIASMDFEEGAANPSDESDPEESAEHPEMPNSDTE